MEIRFGNRNSAGMKADWPKAVAHSVIFETVTWKKNIPAERNGYAPQHLPENPFEPGFHSGQISDLLRS